MGQGEETVRDDYERNGEDYEITNSPTQRSG